MNTKIYQNSKGFSVVVDTNIELAEANTVYLKVKKPSGKIVTWDANKYETTKIAYYIEANDLDEIGIYLIQALVIFPTKRLKGETLSLRIFEYYE